MLELIPRPVAVHVPLAALLPLATPSPLGIWFSSRRSLTLLARCGRHRHVLLIDRDLGSLVRRCPSVVVQLGLAAVAVPSGDLVRARALRVVVAPPFAQTVRALHASFPDALGVPPSIEVPLSRRSAEEVLAVCAAVRGPVVLSRVVYGPLGAGGEPARGG